MKVLYPSERREVEPILKLFGGKVVLIKDEWMNCIYGHDVVGKEIIFKNLLTLASENVSISKTCER